MKTLPDNSVDCVITDPPYGIDYKSNRRTVTDKFYKIINDVNLNWLDDFVSEIYRVMDDNTATYIFCSWHNVDVFKVTIERKFKVKNILVWVKNNHGSGDLKAGFAPKHEFVIYAHKGRSLFRNGRASDVLEFKKITSSKLTHPTEKPVDLMELLVSKNTDVGQVILDPFMGSGSTGVACVNTKRNFIGCELDKSYFDIAQKRIESIL